MNERIVLVGGPRDGEEFTVPAVLPMISVLAAAHISAAIVEATLEVPILHYRPLVGPMDQPSRDDSGRLRYGLST